MKEQKKYWWEDKSKLTEYVRLGDKVYQIDDAISLGKMTADTVPATKEEYKQQHRKI